MAFKLGDVIVDRLQFGYGAKSNGAPLYALTQLTEANIDITASNSIKVNPFLFIIFFIYIPPNIIFKY